ncbi:MAG: glycosyltransferase family 1 protein [Mucilaginibacter sp.]|nr:glycosyltransferase family 1 protein [Mucilaginibacter sp.]
MRLLFLCGSLEPGYDGVGDYTRRLAAEMIRQGHQVTAISLNDTYVNIRSVYFQNAENVKLEVLRIPSACTTKQRFKLAKKWIDKYNPEWLSLQFVIFSFHSKGLPVGLGAFLSRLGKGRRWHIMFHELWVGMPLGASKTHIFWGWLQKKIILSIIFKLKPEVIHTQSRLYFAQLNKLGIKINYLPLFSNVPVANSLVENGKVNTDSVQNIVSMVIFGTIHPLSMIDRLLHEVIIYKEKEKAEVKLIIIGRCGPEQEHWINIWKSAGLNVEVLGEQPVQCISQVLKHASIGISTSAMAMIDKSGTVAAMLEHGLPVLCVAKPWTPRGVTLSKAPNGIFELSKDGLEACIKRNKEKTSYPGVSDATATLIEILSGA